MCLCTTTAACLSPGKKTPPVAMGNPKNPRNLRIDPARPSASAASATDNPTELGDSHFQLPIRRLPTRLNGIDKQQEPSDNDQTDDDSWQAIPSPDRLSMDENIEAGDALPQPESSQAGEEIARFDNDYEKFYEAMVCDDYKSVKKMLDHGISVWHERADGLTPLIFAIYEGLADVVELLLERGASVHHCVNGLLPLAHATFARKNAPRLMQLLLNRGADINVVFSVDKCNVLHWAVVYDAVEGVDFLCSKGVDLESRCSQKRTPLILAAEKGHLIVTKILIAKGADLRSKSDNGGNALMWAAANGHLEVMKYLMDQGLPIDECDEEGLGIMSLLCNCGSVEGVKIVLEKGIDVNAASGLSGNFTPIMGAAFRGHTKVVEVLANHGADLTLENSNGNTVLDIAIMEGHIDIVRVLLKTLGGPTYPLESVALQLVMSKSHHTASSLAAAASSMYHDLCFTNESATGTNWIDWVLQQGGEIVKPYAASRLMEMAMRVEKPSFMPEPWLSTLDYDSVETPSLRHSDSPSVSVYKSLVVSIILKAGADPSLPARGHARNRRTPLHQALMALGNDFEKDTSIVDALLSTGKCKLMAGPTYPQTAFQYILSNLKKWKHGVAEITIFRMLMAIEDVDSDRSDDGTTLMHLAVFYGRKDLIDILLQRGADINAKDNRGQTPFFWGCGLSKPILEFLVSKGANPFAIDNWGRSAISATIFPHRIDGHDSLEYLLDLGLDVNLAADANLEVAIRRRLEDTAIFLFDHGARLPAKSFDTGRPLFYLAVKAGLTQLLDRVLEVDEVNVNDKDYDGNTSLAVACRYEDPAVSMEMVKMLLDAGVDIEIQNHVGDRALHIALEAQNNDVACLLIERGANPHAKGHRNSTPLHTASEFGCLDAAQALIEKGANVHESDCIGHTPLCLADDLAMTELLVNSGADVQASDRYGWTALHQSVYRLDPDVFEFLLKHGGNLSDRTLDDKMDVRERILSLCNNSMRAAFWHVMCTCPGAGTVEIAKDEMEYMLRSCRKYVDKVDE